MKRIALISYKERNLWSSCEKITQQLSTFYAQKFPQALIENVVINSGAYDNLEATNALIHFDPELLIFIDQRLNPIHIISPLKTFNFFKKERRIIYHDFGDPILNAVKIKKICLNLENVKFNLAFTSESNKNLALKLFDSKFYDSISVVPIIPTDLYLFNENCRNKIRKEHNISEDEKLFIYTGRISPEKNVDIILKIFYEALKTRNDITLFLIGEFDDMGPYIHSPVGSHKFYIHRLLNENKHNKIKILHYTENIHEYYHAADAFISLSTLMGEDYGMSVAEALFSGLSCCLTHWRGYQTFKKFNNHICYIYIKENIANLELDHKRLLHFICSFTPSSAREKESLATKEKFEKELSKIDFKFSLPNINHIFFNKLELLRNDLSFLLQENRLNRYYKELWDENT